MKIRARSLVCLALLIPLVAIGCEQETADARSEQSGPSSGSGDGTVRESKPSELLTIVHLLESWSRWSRTAENKERSHGVLVREFVSLAETAEHDRLVAFRITGDTYIHDFRDSQRSVYLAAYALRYHAFGELAKKLVETARRHVENGDTVEARRHINALRTVAKANAHHVDVPYAVATAEILMSIADRAGDELELDDE